MPTQFSTPLPPGVMRWLEKIAGSTTQVKNIVPLPGATSSSLFSLQLETGNRNLALVLRLFTNADWLLAEPDVAQHEAAALQKANQAGVATPRLVDMDASGEQCGVPAILMTRVAGNVCLQPTDLDAWLHQMAEALLPIHALDAHDFPWQYMPYQSLSQLKPPVWSRITRRWEQAFDLLRGSPPQTTTCFIHRDYHPNNVLWVNGHLSGIVDWANACRGAANIDLAWCRMNLIHLHGLKAANHFLDIYQSLAGPAFQYDPYWDLITLIEWLPGPKSVYPGWTAHGIRHITPASMHSTMDDYLEHILSCS